MSRPDQFISTLATSTELRVEPWPDPVIDAVGHDPRSGYAERFWLGILGPSTMWLLRRLVAGFDTSPDGYDLSLTAVARELGLADTLGRNSPFVRSLGRSCQFGAAYVRPDGAFGVRRRLAPLNQRQLIRLPESLQQAHRQWQEAALADAHHDPHTADERKARARRLALTLVELGEAVDQVEGHLVRWRFGMTVARDASTWAWSRHHQGERLQVGGDAA